MAFTTLERDILKITGLTIGPGQSIAAGTVFETVRLTTIDEDSGPLGPLGLNYDPFGLNATETVSFLIDGVPLARSVPSLFVAQVTTDAGSFRALVFSIGGDTYLIPQTNVVAADSTVLAAPATLGTSAFTSIRPFDYGLLPENANTFEGSVLVEQSFGTLVTGIGTSSYRLHDADTVRGNADSIGEEIALPAVGVTPTSAPTALSFEGVQEIAAVLRFDDGTVLSGVQGIVRAVAGSYGQVTRFFLFDDAALAAAGQTLGDVAAVETFAVAAHGLDWEELGFTLTVPGDGGPPTPDPEPEVLTLVTGTNRADSLVGTAGRDVIRGLGRSDTMDGGAGADAFVFGTETRDGRRDTDRIVTYEVGFDGIYFDAGAVVRSVAAIAGGVRIVFEGDRDRVEVFGEDIDVRNVGIFSADFIA